MKKIRQKIKDFKLEDFKDGQTCNVKFRWRKSIKGVITIEDSDIFICQNDIEGTYCKDKKGFNFSYCIGDTQPRIDAFINNYEDGITAFSLDIEEEKDTPQLVKRGTLVVRTDDGIRTSLPKYKTKGVIFRTIRDSHGAAYRGGVIDFYNFRLATKEEEIWFNALHVDVANINNMHSAITTDYVVCMDGDRSYGAYMTNYVYKVIHKIGRRINIELDSRGSTTNGWSLEFFRDATDTEAKLYENHNKPININTPFNTLSDLPKIVKESKELKIKNRNNKRIKIKLS